MSDNAITTEKTAYRTRVLMIGGLVGTVLGVLSAILYLRAADEVHGEEGSPPAPEAGDAVKVGVALLGIIRTITDWAKRDSPGHAIDQS